MKLKTIGIDLAKLTFFLIGLDEHNQTTMRKKLSRTQLTQFIARLAPCTIAMEACSSAHHWARMFKEFGHEVYLLPPQHVKGYLRGQKNDYNDAAAIAEACAHGRIRPVAIKSVAQQDQQALLKMRKKLKAEQTALANQMRGLLAEYGILIPKGIHHIHKRIPDIQSNLTLSLTPMFRALLAQQYAHYQAVCEQVDWYDQQLEGQAKTDTQVKRLMTAPGFGVINANIVSAWMGSGRQFKRGRDASAALGLVPRQHSTGGRDRLFSITKHGDSYVRTQIVHGARAVVLRANDKTDALSLWIMKLVATRGHNKAVIALANKMVRIAWAMTVKQEPYRAVTASAN